MLERFKFLHFSRGSRIAGFSFWKMGQFGKCGQAAFDSDLLYDGHYFRMVECAYGKVNSAVSVIAYKERRSAVLAEAALDERG